MELADQTVEQTNVAKVALAVADGAEAGNPQRVHYEAGVGTRRRERLLGGAFGVGLSRNVQDCYRFLVENYEPGDELFFFGFSRGAFTARSTVGLVRNSGILRPEHRDRIEEAYALYRDRDKDSEPSGIAAELFRRSYSHADVTSTSSACGTPSARWASRSTASARRAEQAAGRSTTRRSAATCATPTTRSRSTSGASRSSRRCGCKQDDAAEPDAGAGVVRRRALRRRRRLQGPGLSEIPLLWMVEKARACGLAFKPDHLVVKGTDVRRRRSAGPGSRWRRTRAGRAARLAHGLLPAPAAPTTAGWAGEDGADVDGGALASSARTRYDEDRRLPPARPLGVARQRDARAGGPLVRPASTTTGSRRTSAASSSSVACSRRMSMLTALSRRSTVVPLRQATRRRGPAKGRYARTDGMGEWRPRGRLRWLTRSSRRSFIGRAGPGARRGFKEFGVPASVTIAQAILESGWGTAHLGNANNYFGIKAQRSGGRVMVGSIAIGFVERQTHEVYGGTITVTAPSASTRRWPTRARPRQVPARELALQAGVRALQRRRTSSPERSSVRGTRPIPVRGVADRPDEEPQPVPVRPRRASRTAGTNPA